MPSDEAAAAAAAACISPRLCFCWMVSHRTTTESGRRAEGAPLLLVSASGQRHVRRGAMAGSLILVPFYLCVLCLMLCGSVADSRAVFMRELYEPTIPEEFGIDDGPQTFTMQDHFNYLRERELERRKRGVTATSTLAVTSHIEETEQPIFVSDYCSEANKKNDP